jgi:hypothetical protein
MLLSAIAVWPPLGVSALSDQVAAGAITMGERLGSDDAQVLNADRCRIGAAAVRTSHGNGRTQISRFCIVAVDAWLASPKLLALGMRNCAMTCGDAGPGRCRSGYK